MGTIFKKQFTRPVPDCAEIVTVKSKTIARWRRRGGSNEEADVVTLGDGRQVIRVESDVFYCTFRGPDNRVTTVSTGCKDKSNAEQFLAERERERERVKAGVATPEEVRRVKHTERPIEEHVQDYLDTMRCVERHRHDTGTRIRVLLEACQWRTLADLRRDDLETWLAKESRIEKDGLPVRSARTRNAHHTALVGFTNWLVNAKRLGANPFSGMKRAKEEEDPRRNRRALTREEFDRLVDAARTAPKRPAAKSKSSSTARPAERLTGPERAELYLVLVQTGLRIGELAKLKIADLRLDHARPHIDLPAKVDKKRKQRFMPLRPELVELFRQRVHGKKPSDHPFNVPGDLIKRFNGDCKRAGIPKRDDRGKTVDIHSLRMTFNTWLLDAGVPLRIAQELMRHADISMTAKVYTDPRIFDLSAAVDKLPDLSLKLQSKLQCTHVTRSPRESTGVHQSSDETRSKAAS
jgi:integrase